MKIQKELNPEVKSALANIESLVQQILGMEQAEGEGEGGEGNGGGQPTVDDIMKALATMKAETSRQEPVATGAGGPASTTEEKPDETKAKKDVVSGKADASTANDPANTRIDDQPPENDDLASLLRKALTAVEGNKPEPVQKSMDPTLTALTAVAKSLKAVADRQSQQGMVLGELLEGLGVAKAFEAKPTVLKGMPLANLPGQITAEDLIAALVNKSTENQAVAKSHGGDKGQEVRKDLGTIATALWA
jgi:hypothetical protein